MLATIIGGNIAAPSTSLTRRVLHTILTKAPVLLLLLAFMASTQSAFAATAGTEFNTSANGQKFTLTNDASAAKPMTQDIVDSAGSVSVLIWGPVLAAVLGGIIIWMGHDCFPCSANTAILDFEGKPKPAAIALGKIFLD